jgi:hypothetical protein
MFGADPTGTVTEDYTAPNGSQAAYYVEAGLFGSRGWSAWVPQSELSRLDLAHSRSDAVRWGVSADSLTLCLAGGGRGGAGGLAGASRAYTGVGGSEGTGPTGADARAPAPPSYVYEPWMDVINEGEGEAAPNGGGFSGGARVKRDLQTIVEQSEKHGIPTGVLGVEGWHVVPGRESFFRDLRDQGYRLSAYWSPFIAEDHPTYETARELDILVKNPKGDPHPIVTNRANRSFVIDFTHPNADGFWAEQIWRSCDLGFEAFMHDFGEFVHDTMRFHDGTPPEAMHNEYPVLYHEAARNAVDAYAARNPDFEPFFYVRAGFSGVGSQPGVSASTPGVFPGDETTDWSEGSGLPSVVPTMLNLALSGSFSFTTDVGGYLDLYTPQTSAELFTRWSQLAALTPVSRIHNSTFSGSVYPWEFDDATLDGYRRYARLKMRLKPLVDEWSKRAARDGIVGPVRPLVLEENTDAARSIDDQWLLGNDLLVAPILTEGATERSVYLPKGSRWQQVRVAADGSFVDVGSPRRGGQRIRADGPYRDIPIFRRL